MPRRKLRTIQFEWWSIQLPSRWTFTQHPECVTFQADPPLGALQISAARKEQGAVTNVELEEFSDQAAPKGVQREAVRYGLFDGHFIQFTKEGTFWKQWWLRHGNLMLYVTYNVEERHLSEEQEKVRRALTTLQPR